MQQLLVWVTRPSSHEILMGGERDLRVWLVRPHYSHRSRSAGRLGSEEDERFHDTGWRDGHSEYGLRVKPLLRQHEALRNAVWRDVFLSVCPRGMSYEQGVAWHNTQRGNESFDGHPITMWHELTDDREWEGKCNTSHKRFLLEVDLLSLTVRRIAPNVLLRDEPGHRSRDFVETDSITHELAVEYWHKEPDADRVPF